MLKTTVKTLALSFTFWLVLLSILTICNHYSGGDSKSIVLISLHPVLSPLSRTDWAREWLNAGRIVPAATILGEFSVRWYYAHLVCAIVTGGVLDGIKAFFCRLYRRGKTPVTAGGDPS